MIVVRRFEVADAKTLPKIFHAAVHGIAAKDYTPEQCAAWSPREGTAAGYLDRVGQDWEIFVAVNESAPVGFIELEPSGHIDCFYCHPKFAGTGVGRQLYNSLENAALDRGLDKLWVEASAPAQRFFTRQGFTTLARQTITRNGVALFNYRMEKRLNPLP